MASLFVSGVWKVALTAPAADIAAVHNRASALDNLTLTAAA